MQEAENGAELKRALDALRRGDHETALRAAIALLAADPHNPALCQLGALAALRAGHHREAQMLARRSLAIEPAHGQTLIVYGRAAKANGDDAEAAAAFRQAVALLPGVAEPMFLLCGMLLKAGHPEARTLLDALDRRFPQEGAGWEEMGKILASAGRSEAALICFDRAARVASSFELALQRGLALRALERHAEAANAFRTAIDHNPASAWAHVLLALCHQELGAREAAAEAARAALALDPALAEAFEGAAPVEPSEKAMWRDFGRLRRSFVA